MLSIAAIAATVFSVAGVRAARSLSVRRMRGTGSALKTTGNKSIDSHIADIFHRIECSAYKSEDLTMNKDQVKGVTKDVAGKVQEQAGKLIGSKEQQIKGLSKQISGKLQKGVGDVKQSVDDINKS